MRFTIRGRSLHEALQDQIAADSLVRASPLSQGIQPGGSTLEKDPTTESRTTNALVSLLTDRCHLPGPQTAGQPSVDVDLARSGAEAHGSKDETVKTTVGSHGHEEAPHTDQMGKTGEVAGREIDMSASQELQGSQIVTSQQAGQQASQRASKRLVKRK